MMLADKAFVYATNPFTVSGDFTRKVTAATGET